MILELIVDTAQKSNGVGALQQATADAAIKLRAERGCALLGAWTSEFASLNQLVTLWRHADASAWAKTTAELADLPEWRERYLSVVRPVLHQRQIKLLKPEKPTRETIEPGHVYELRTYDLQPGGVPEFSQYMRDVLPVREKYSLNVMFTSALTGSPDQLVHLWAYRDLEHRTQTRNGVGQEPAWKDYLQKIRPLGKEMHSALLIPTAFSPLR